MEKVKKTSSSTTVKIKRANSISNHTKAIAFYWLAVLLLLVPFTIGDLYFVWWIFAELAFGSAIVGMFFNRKSDDESSATPLQKVTPFMKIILCALGVMIFFGILVAGIVTM